MVREYELMYIVVPEVDDDGLRQATDSVEGLIVGLGGEIEKTTMWGRRRLAYEVKHMRDGHYVISHLKLDGQRVREVERALRIHDTVFRHLLVRRDGRGSASRGPRRARGRCRRNRNRWGKRLRRECRPRPGRGWPSRGRRYRRRGQRQRRHRR